MLEFTMLINIPDLSHSDLVIVMVNLAHNFSKKVTGFYSFKNFSF